MRGKLYLAGMLVSGVTATIGAIVGFGQWVGWFAQDMTLQSIQTGSSGATSFFYNAQGVKTGTLTGTANVFGAPVPLGTSGWVIAGWAATVCLIIATLLWQMQRLPKAAVAVTVEPETHTSSVTYNPQGELVGVEEHDSAVTAYKCRDDRGNPLDEPLVTSRPAGE